MKILVNIRLKNVLFGCLGLLLAAANTFGQAPIPPVTPDFPAAGGRGTSGVEHTGTDALIYKGQRLQVMTWDTNSNNIMLSWSFENGLAAGSQSIDKAGFRFSDPDVVVAQYGKDLYAGLVYIRTPLGSLVGQAFYLPLTWNGAGFTAGNAIALGATTNPVGAPRRHATPNVDATSDGLIAVVWQESVVETATITVTSPSYPTPGFTYTQDVTFGESYTTLGYINGSLLNCTGTRGKLVSGAPRLLEQSLSPDVALSEGGAGQSIVSFSYVRYYFDPVAYALSNSLVVRQVHFDCLSPVSKGVKEWAGGISEPRIAATANTDPTRIREIEVVGAAASGGCNIPTTYGILNYGYSNGDFRPGPTNVEPFNNAAASQPVVAYQAQLGLEGVYVVAWTGNGYPKGNSNDIWARTLVGGTLLYPDYSRVNMQADGPQQVPSVAGRHLLEQDAAYLFYDQAQSQISYKISGGIAGNSMAPLRPALSVGTTSASDASFQSYPNPFAGSTVFLLRPLAGEVMREIIVYDMLGREVDRMPLQNGVGTQEVNWQGPKSLPAGTYSAKLITSNRTETLRLSKIK